MIDKTVLKAAILSEIDERKEDWDYVSNVDENGEETTTTIRILPHGDPGMEKLAEAIAEAVVIHLQKYLEVKLGIDPETGVTQPTNVMFGTLLPYTNVLPGVGGGIVGPTTTFPTPLQITGGTLLVPPGNVQ